MAKKSKRSSSSPLSVLPEELLVEVLLKLPVESLVALRGVCKLFKITYISSKYFRGSHVQLWANRETRMKHVFLKQDFAPDDGHDPVSRGNKLCSEFAKSALDFRQPRNCRFLFEEDEFKLQFGGCCDGILCFYEFWGVYEAEKARDVVIYICNPALNECKVISRRRELLHSNYRRMTKVCFAHDPASGDYKIIVVSVCKDGRRRSKVYVFRLSDCCWRKIDTSNAGTGPWCCRQKSSQISDLVVHNGSVYWMTSYEYFSEDYNVLNVLDLHLESVGEIALPKYLVEKFTPVEECLLLRHQGSLAIRYDYFDAMDGTAELCLMKEEENGGISWGNQIKFDLRVACKLCGEKFGSKRCGCFHRFVCKMPMATSSLGSLMSYKKKTTYVLGNSESTESLDGSSLGNPRPAGAGAVLRDNQGKVIYAVSKYLGHSTNLQAEARALILGLENCLIRGISKIEIESDSMLLVQMIRKMFKIPWKLIPEIRRLEHLLLQFQFSIEHIYREVNSIADALAKEASMEQATRHSSSTRIDTSARLHNPEQA